MRRGKEDKIIVKVEPMDGVHMSEYDFEIDLYVYSNRVVTLKKSDPSVIKVDDDNYKVTITSEMTSKLGRGKVLMDFIGFIPDADFPDGYRTTIKEGICTGVTI